MTQYDQEHIDIDTFDREYLLEELLPQALLENISTASDSILPRHWTIVTEVGKLYFQSGNCEQLSGDIIKNIIKHQPEEETTIKDSSGGCTMTFPIAYELELKGYMAVWISNPSKTRSVDKARAGINLFQQFMRLKHQTLLTSGLHGQVVEDSYAELKTKAEALARSEEKYRNLAANLEIEVQQKTEEIRKANAHLMQQEKMAAIGQLSAGMAHEINNPLGFILSNLTSLKNYGQDLAFLMQHYRQLKALCSEVPDRGNLSSLHAQCNAIEKNEQTLDGDFLLSDIPVLIDESLTGAQRIQKIVADLKAVARPGESQKEMINIQDSIDAVLTIVQNGIGPKVTVHKAFHPVPLVYGSPQEISQVWLNLIMNALDALQDEGTLKITTHADRNQVSVTITDTGSGIAQDNIPKIFDPFFTTKEVGKGTGLGLHLVYHLITKHGGRIDVKSESGQGTSFIVHLPIEWG